jgi:deoxyribodipyrimidine photolyase-like uncharacterized protein
VCNFCVYKQDEAYVDAACYCHGNFFLFLLLFSHNSQKLHHNIHIERIVSLQEKKKEKRENMQKWSSYAIRGGGQISSSSFTLHLYKVDIVCVCEPLFM